MSTNNLLGRKQEIAFSILAKALTARGVKVSIAGGSSYTDGKRIVIGVGEWDVMVSSLLHEAGHLNYTDFSAFPDDDIFSTVNVLEDIRIDFCNIKAFPGALNSYQISRTFLLEFIERRTFTNCLDDILFYMLLVGNLKNGLSNLKPIMKKFCWVPSHLAALCERYAGLAQTAKNTKEIVELARAFLKELSSLAKDDGNGDSQDDASGDSQDDASGDSQDDASGDSQDDASGDSQDDANGDSQDDANGDSQDDASGDSQDGANGDSQDGANGDSQDDANGDSQDDANCEASSSKKGGSPRFSDIDLDKRHCSMDVGEILELYKSTQSDGLLLPPPAEVLGNEVLDYYRKHRPKYKFPDSNQRVTGAIANAVKVMFRQSNMKLRGGAQYGELNEDYIVDAYLGNPAAKTYRRETSANLAVGILLDASGSMGEPMIDSSPAYMACQAALSTALALGKEKGVKTGIALFGGSYLMMKDFHQPLMKDLPYVALGGTHTGSAMMELGSSLLVQRAQKKVMFIITDGEPESPHDVQLASKWLQQHNILLLPIMLGKASAGFEGVELVNVLDIKHLPNQLIKLLKQVI
ncbi:hypothetical protein L5M11_22240 [Shewanella sp. SM87]|uniref:vWA domain-containing protein n=1 Tax=Shewanella sp. SM87 TaxID=2912808 RepID=UPI0021D9F194|nr:hypothetical protein [Shewanella sp. SM87]MCU8010213.1 hypothetical protein [Shewanella sp. SM87]